MSRGCTRTGSGRRCSRTDVFATAVPAQGGQGAAAARRPRAAPPERPPRRARASARRTRRPGAAPAVPTRVLGSRRRRAVPLAGPRPARLPPSKALATVRETLVAETLDLEQADQWLRALNDMRLVLGTRWDVTEQLDYGKLDLNAPRGRERGLRRSVVAPGTARRGVAVLLDTVPRCLSQRPGFPGRADRRTADRRCDQALRAPLLARARARDPSGRLHDRGLLPRRRHARRYALSSGRSHSRSATSGRWRSRPVRETREGERS